MTGRVAWSLLLVSVLALPARSDSDDVRDWSQPLSSASKTVRERAIGQLIARGAAGKLELRRLASHVDPRVRASVAVALARLDAGGSVPLLRKMLRDPDGTVRSSAIHSLIMGFRLKESQRATRHPGIAALRADVAADPVLERRLAHSVGYWSGMFVYRELSELVSSNMYYEEMFDPVSWLGRWATGPLLRLFCQEPGDGRRGGPHFLIQSLAGRALGTLGDRSAIAPLEKIYTSQTHNRYILRTAAVALYKLGVRRHASELIDRYQRAARGWGGAGTSSLKPRALWDLAYLYQQLGRYKEAIGAYKEGLAIPKNPYGPIIHYNLACAYSKLRKAEHGLYHLQHAIRLSYKDNLADVERDRDLDFLRKDKRYKKLLADHTVDLQLDLAKER